MASNERKCKINAKSFLTKPWTGNRQVAAQIINLHRTTGCIYYLLERLVHQRFELGVDLAV